jgi:hypothetical protein
VARGRKGRRRPAKVHAEGRREEGLIAEPPPAVAGRRPAGPAGLLAATGAGWREDPLRIESRRPSLSKTQGRRLAEYLARRAESRTSPALQIDFDAAESERAFYRELLQALAGRLGPEAKISITALASWCLDDRWLAGVPIAEAVPMLFDMGREGEAVRGRLDKGEDFREPLCRGSYGLATYQPWPRLKSERAIYVFADRPWTEAAWSGLP